MKINQKIIMGFLVVALLILAVSYISVTTQENLVKRSQEIAEKVLPGAIAEATKQSVTHSRKLILGSSAAIFFLALVWGFFISRLISKPIKELSEAAGKIGKGQLDIKIEPTSKDEIGQLAISFNKMIKDLQMITVSRDAFAQEVAEHNKATEILQKSEEKLSGIVNSVTDTMIMVDDQYNVVWNNDIAKKLLRPDVIGKKCYRVYHGRDEICKPCIAEACFNDSKIHEFETEIIGADGNRMSLCGKASVAARDENGHPMLVVEFLRDITDRKQAEKALQTAYDQAIIYAEQLKEQIEERSRAEEEKKKLEIQLQRAQKMEAVGTLAGGVAHDFNNILQAISGYVQLLLIKKEINNTERLYLKQIDKSTQKAAELTKQLLIFGRKVESELRPLSLNQEIIEIYKLFQRTIPKMIDIELDLAEDLEHINADPSQLEQIMMNLGLNARDAMPDGGKLTFKTKNVILDKAYCKTHVDVVPGKYIQLSVSDTGLGMNREILEHIFEPFYTTKETGKGTGLGLAIVYGLVESHGGNIMCYSEPGQGTVFKVYFPAIAIEELEQKIEEEIVIRGGHETVLIVDDEEALRDQGRDILNKYGYTTIAAESGEKAIEIYKRGKDKIDLVILDIGMPGMGGYNCLEQLSKINPEIKVIVASGYATSSRVKETLKSGASDFIGKPYRFTDMLKKVRELLDQ